MRTLTITLLFLSACVTTDSTSKTETGQISDDTGEVLDSDTAGRDADGDGFAPPQDCNDADATVHPDAREVCDGIDNDCDGLIDDEEPDVFGTDTWHLDYDLDGYGGDQLSLEACEQPDGYVDNRRDCNDTDPDIHPDAEEACDGVDNDCDGVIDGNDATGAPTWYVDDDGDGFGTTDSTLTACDPPAGFSLHDGDCDDADPAYHPGASEADCTDPNDYNCDGSVGFEDADSDGFAACEDCDDANADINDDAIEICDGLDNDCDSDIDSDDSSLDGALTFYGDSDGDGYGGTQYQAEACEAPPGYVTNADDCDDLDAASHPGASEVCDGADNDCDSDVDEGVGSTWYADDDGDGYGNGAVSQQSCDAPSGYVGNAQDCDDFSAATSPAAYEICDGTDNDCDGTTDEDDAINASTWYVDADGDGYGASTGATIACNQPSGHAANDTDCDDADVAVSPGAPEVCDSVDNDCDGTIDEADATDAATWYADLDGDGYGNPSSTTSACAAPSGTVADATDCDDTSATSNPGGTEVCDFSDNDCDGTIDEDDASDATTWYQDADGDGYGDATVSTTACIQPAGFANNSNDCDDGSSSASPGLTETCDGVDNNCDGTVDEQLLGAGSQCGASSCAAILTSNPSATNGTWYIDPDGNGAYEAYCNFNGTGGPWTWHTATEPSAYWSFDGSDVTASDVGGYSGTLHGATNASSTVPATGFGNSLQSDNSDSGYMDLSPSVPVGSSSTTPQYTWTIIFWGQNDNCSNNQIAILFDNNTYMGDLYYAASFQSGSTFSQTGSGCSSYVNTWRHFAHVDDGSSLRVWQDGAELSPDSYSYSSGSRPPINRLMSRPGFGTNGLGGYIDDLAIYDTALTEAEIQRIYNQSGNGRPLRWQ
jgi:hypothetical protein